MASESTALLTASIPDKVTEDRDGFVGAKSYHATTSDGVGSRQTSWPADWPPPSSDGSTGELRRKGSAHKNRWKSLTVNIGLTSIFLLARVS